MEGAMHPEGTAHRTSDARTADDIVAEARRRAHEIIRRAEEPGGPLQPLIGPGGGISGLFASIDAQIDRLATTVSFEGFPAEPEAEPAPVVVPTELWGNDGESTGEPDSEATPDSPPDQPGPVEDGLEPPPPGRRIIQVEMAPVPSAAAVADLERDLVGIAGVSGVSIHRRDEERVTFLVGVDVPDTELDFSSLLDRGAQLESAESGRIVLRLEAP